MLKCSCLVARAFGYSVSWVTPNTLSREYAESSVLFYVHIPSKWNMISHFKI